MVAHFEHAVQHQIELDDFHDTRKAAIDNLASNELKDANNYPFHAFLSNLNFNVTRDDIIKFLGETYGTVRSFKFVGKSKFGHANTGLATVQFEGARAMRRLLDDAGRTLLGRPFAAREDSQQKTSRSSHRNSGKQAWPAASLRFGCWDVDTNSFFSKMVTSTCVRLELLPVIRSLVVYFSIEKEAIMTGGFVFEDFLQDNSPSYRADIRLGCLVGHVHYSSTGKETVLTMRLNRPPYLFKKKPSSLRDLIGLGTTDREEWERCCSLEGPAGDAELGRCNSIQFTFPGHDSSEMKELLVKFAQLHLRPRGYSACTPTTRAILSLSIKGSSSDCQWTPEHVALLSYHSRYLL